jgi:hypothetical protein
MTSRSRVSEINEMVETYYRARMPVMGSSDDDVYGHTAAMHSAKLVVIRRLIDNDSGDSVKTDNQLISDIVNVLNYQQA